MRISISGAAVIVTVAGFDSLDTFETELVDAYGSVIAPFVLRFNMSEFTVSITKNARQIWALAATFNRLREQTKLKVSHVEIVGRPGMLKTVRRAIALISTAYTIEKPVHYIEASASDGS